MHPRQKRRGIVQTIARCSRFPQAFLRWERCWFSLSSFSRTLEKRFWFFKITTRRWKWLHLHNNLRKIRHICWRQFGKCLRRCANCCNVLTIPNNGGFLKFLIHLKSFKSGVKYKTDIDKNSWILSCLRVWEMSTTFYAWSSSVPHLWSSFFVVVPQVFLQNFPVGR